MGAGDCPESVAAVTPGGQGFGKVLFPENLGFAKDAYFNDRDEYLSDRLTDEVLKYVSENRERPFFIYLADHAVHAPWKPKPELLKKYQRKQGADGDRRNRAEYAATIEAVDQNVGRVVAELDRLKLKENTLVIFTSDNGATPQFTAPLRGIKGELYEGGIRVPLVFNGAGVMSPGRSSDVPVTSVDLYPTLLEVAGLKQSSDQILDGLSLVPVLAGKSGLPSRLLFWHFPCYVGRATPSSALRDGDFKLVEFFEDGGHTELFNLRSDPNEERNLASEMPAKAAELYRNLQSWQKETKATIPSAANPKYDPQVERPRGRQENQPQKNPKGGGNRGKRKAREPTD